MSPTARRVLMALLLATAAGFARLGVWQLSRLRERRAGNLVTAAARRAPPVILTSRTARTDTLLERRVVAWGSYDHAHDIVVRGETFNGVPGVRVVTPLLLDSAGPAILIDRGFLPAPDAITVELRGSEEPGEVEVRGILSSVPTGSGQPIAHAGRTTWRRLDLRALRAHLPYPVLPVLVKQSPDPSLPRFPRRLEPAPIDEGPHLAYAVQWFLFAGLAAAFGLLVVGRGGRGRGRRDSPG